MKRESDLKSAFMKELHAQLPQFLVFIQATAGAPDRAIVGNGQTSWWEFKHATPGFLSPGNQELMCMRLAVQGFCRYVVWCESSTGGGSRTMIMHPKTIHERQSTPLIPEVWCPGFNHKWLVGYVKQVHGITT